MPRSVPVRQTSRKTSASPASETQALRPVTRQPSSTGTARVVIAAASEPACGSVSEKPPSNSPRTRPDAWRSTSSGVPKRAIAFATALCIESAKA